MNAAYASHSPSMTRSSPKTRSSCAIDYTSQVSCIEELEQTNDFDRNRAVTAAFSADRIHLSSFCTNDAIAAQLDENAQQNGRNHREALSARWPPPVLLVWPCVCADDDIRHTDSHVELGRLHAQDTVHDATLVLTSSTYACRCCVEKIDGTNCTNAVFNDYNNYTYMFAADDDLCNYCNFSRTDACTEQFSNQATISTHSAQLLAKLGQSQLQRSIAVRLRRQPLPAVARENRERIRRSLFVFSQEPTYSNTSSAISSG